MTSVSRVNAHVKDVGGHDENQDRMQDHMQNANSTHVLARSLGERPSSNVSLRPFSLEKACYKAEWSRAHKHSHTHTLSLQHEHTTLFSSSTSPHANLPLLLLLSPNDAVVDLLKSGWRFGEPSAMGRKKGKRGNKRKDVEGGEAVREEERAVKVLEEKEAVKEEEHEQGQEVAVQGEDDEESGDDEEEKVDQVKSPADKDKERTDMGQAGGVSEDVQGASQEEAGEASNDAKPHPGLEQASQQQQSQQKQRAGNAVGGLQSMLASVSRVLRSVTAWR